MIQTQCVLAHELVLEKNIICKQKRVGLGCVHTDNFYDGTHRPSTAMAACSGGIA
jgi:hypothetical protein